MISREIVQKFKKIVGKDNVLADKSELLVYECDGLTFHKAAPEAIVFVHSAQQVAEIVKVAHNEGIPFLARGAGTGLSGGCMPVEGGIIIEMSRMKRILEVNLEDRYVVVEPGVINLELSKAVNKFGYYYAPDPSSQMACTIGGNIAENAGGPHCLKYGMTTNHVLALEIVLPNGDLMHLGSPTADYPSYDLVGLFVGSEGTFGVVTKAWLRLTRLPQQIKTMLAAFHSMLDATDTTSDIIAAGVIPAALEIIDQVTIQTVEASVYAAGYPKEAAAVLLIEVDGLKAGMDELAEKMATICRRHRAFEIRTARDDKERDQLWAGRKKAFGAAGRLNANLYLADTVVPRTKLSEVLGKVYDIAAQYSLTVANVFHAGDGNLHPVFVYNGKDKEETERMLKACEEILKVSVEAGGVISGEHGVGFEKKEFMELIFTPIDLTVMQKVKDVFNPQGLCNPGKVFPMRKSCGETSVLDKIKQKGYDFFPV